MFSVTPASTIKVGFTVYGDRDTTLETAMTLIDKLVLSPVVITESKYNTLEVEERLSTKNRHLTHRAMFTANLLCDATAALYQSMDSTKQRTSETCLMKSAHQARHSVCMELLTCVIALCLKEETFSVTTQVSYFHLS